MTRLNKYMAECGVGSRRACDAIIAAGRVYVNGAMQTELGTKINDERDQVQVDGKTLLPPIQHRYLVLNKPVNVITTASDDRRRKTVLEFVPSTARLFPVGRLDKETTGLLLLTNDGELAYRLTHPKFAIDKIYEVTLDSSLSAEHAESLQSGVVLDEGMTAPCRISFPVDRKKQLLHITVHQGWKRQVRRMFAHFGYRVIRLKRLAIGSLQLGDLQEGEWRELTNRELKVLQKQVGL